MSITGIPKRRGRPATGRDSMITARLPQDIVDALARACREMNAPRSAIIREAVTDYLRDRGYLPKKRLSD